MRNARMWFGDPPSTWRPRIVLLNGPPECGKDTIAPYVCRALGGAGREKFSQPMKVGLPRVFSIILGELERDKDTRRPEFGSRSWREIQISFSETWMKPLFGDDIFGRLCAYRVMSNWGRFAKGIVISDCGFATETRAFINRIPNCRPLLVRLHRDGCDFSYDSRGYIDLPDIVSVDLNNNTTAAECANRIATVMKELVSDPTR